MMRALLRALAGAVIAGLALLGLASPFLAGYWLTCMLMGGGR